MAGYLLGFDVGSSSIKVALIYIDSGKVIASDSSPKRELPIQAPRQGWAEQDPELWWKHCKTALQGVLSQTGTSPDEIQAIGISYQMHGLVLVNQQLEVLRPAIIWCDSRAVEIGNQAFQDIGPEKCLKRLLNSPGNFTASKLKWVQENEPEIFSRIYKAMLPGDYIALKMTGEIKTTASGLSECILWDYQNQCLADFLLNHYSISRDLIPELVDTFSIQGTLTREAAAELDLKKGIPVSYRGGDQPNNALSLSVLNPGEIAATAGTSGVVCGVGDKPAYDHLSRVNTFIHVNYSAVRPRYCTLLCVNGTGILNSWIKHNLLDSETEYEKMNSLAAEVPIGADGLIILPFGNGAERTLENRNIGASIHGLDFNIHNRSHMLRASQEGIVFALNHGLDIMRKMGLTIQTVRAGNANMFLSPLFASAFAAVTGAVVELYDTDGAQGAALGAGIGAGIYMDIQEAFRGLSATGTIEPDRAVEKAYEDAYSRWVDLLSFQLRQA